MSAGTYFRAQAYNNAWANYRFYAACAALSVEAFAAPRTGFFPSLARTLNHILAVDWFYVSALEGHCIGSDAAFGVEIPHPDFHGLCTEQALVDRRLLAVCEELSDAQLRSVVTMPRPRRIQSEQTDRILLHLFQHQIHHRGQAHTMLLEAGVEPPQLDEFFPGDEVEYAFRAADFAALGFSEQHIWREAAMTEDAVTQTVELAAPRERVWQAITDHAQFGTWFRARLDGPFELGGTVTAQITLPGYEHMAWGAQVEELDASAGRFVFRWWDATLDLPPGSGNRVTFTVAEVAAGTLLTISEAGFVVTSDGQPERDAWIDSSTQGWAAQAVNIKDYLLT